MGGRSYNFLNWKLFSEKNAKEVLEVDFHSNPGENYDICNFFEAFGKW
jgi:hypothetical protein